MSSNARDSSSPARLPGARWVKSSYSGPTGGNCVEVAFLRDGVAIRDSQNPADAMLRFTSATWGAFLSSTKSEVSG